MSATQLPRRRYRRCTLRVEVEIRSDAGCRREEATTLGAGGLFVRTADPLPVGSSVEVALSLAPDADAHALAGRVAWTRPLPQVSPGMGIEFTDRAGSLRLARELDALDPPA